jgi:hypothetical protein
MVTVGIYIYINGVARRIELFDDEKISLNSSVQDASDISKVYTDFSQSFTVPANDYNNAIFSHWYENSIDGGFDARKRKKAYIELDTIPFRNGNIQLQKATIKNGVPENYTLTFFGSLVSLKDTFAGKKLSELDYTSYSIPYSSDEVIDRVSGEISNDIKFPLISSKRVWQDTGTTENINTSAGAILTNELFPALRVSKIFEAIETNYGINLTGNFLTDQRFTNAFLWLKNADTFVSKSNDLQFDYISYDFGGQYPVNDLITVDLTDNTFEYFGLMTDINFCNVYFLPTCNVSGVQSYFNVYRNDVLLYTVPFTSSTSEINAGAILHDAVGDAPFGTGVIKVTVNSDTPITFTSRIRVIVEYVDPSIGTVLDDDNYILASNPQSTTANLDLKLYMPDMKVEDFFSGILKMFNLTCIGYEENVYTIEQIEDWYGAGDIKDITKYIISDDVDISKLETFKKINFNYTKSESFMNVAYLGNAGFEYGDLKADLNSEGSEYNVQLPFENILFNKFTGQNLQVGYSLKTDFAPYIPKPIILYDYGTLQTCNFYLKGSGAAGNILTYNAFGQDTIVSGINHSLNFGLEISSLLLTPINNSLYANYYKDYLENIYDQKSRKYNVKALLPISILTSIKLNNRLIIRDKRYIINNMKIDLTSGEVDFELINDFRGEFIPQPPIPLAFDYSPTDYTEDYFIN